MWLLELKLDIDRTVRQLIARFQARYLDTSTNWPTENSHAYLITWLLGNLAIPSEEIGRISALPYSEVCILTTLMTPSTYPHPAVEGYCINWNFTTNVTVWICNGARTDRAWHSQDGLVTPLDRHHSYHSLSCPFLSAQISTVLHIATLGYLTYATANPSSI